MKRFLRNAENNNEGNLEHNSFKPSITMIGSVKMDQTGT